MMQFINPEKLTLKDLLDKETVKNQWLNKFKRERRPGTEESYLGYLRQFYFFLQCTSPKKFDVSPKVLNSLVAQMTQWSKSFHKLVKDRFWEKQMLDMESLCTPEQIQEFSSSDVARAAVRMLDEYQEKPEGTMPNQSEYTSVTLFDDDECNAFYKLLDERNAFCKLIGSNESITRGLVKERLEGEPKLCHLLKRCTLLQLADKVRTEWKHYAKKCKYTTLNSIHS